jgi:hypothetical protein
MFLWPVRAMPLPLPSLPFSFTFKFSVAGLSNPFATTAASSTEQSEFVLVPEHDVLGNSNAATRRLSPSPAPSSSSTAPAGAIPTLFSSNSKKRGWEPSFAEPSYSKTTTESTTGYLDTPAKHRDIASSLQDMSHHGEGEFGSCSGFSR